MIYSYFVKVNIEIFKLNLNTIALCDKDVVF